MPPSDRPDRRQRSESHTFAFSFAAINSRTPLTPVHFCPPDKMCIRDRLCSSGMYYMDTIANTIQGGTVLIDVEGEVSFDPQLVAPDEDLTIIVDGAQGRFRTTNWYITAAVTLLSGILAYFVSGHALKPLRSFASQVEQVQMSNLADMKINEDVLPEFRQFSHSFNQMLQPRPKSSRSFVHYCQAYKCCLLQTEQIGRAHV